MKHLSKNKRFRQVSQEPQQRYNSSLAPKWTRYLGHVGVVSDARWAEFLILCLTEFGQPMERHRTLADWSGTKYKRFATIFSLQFRRTYYTSQEPFLSCQA